MSHIVDGLGSPGSYDELVYNGSHFKKEVIIESSSRTAVIYVGLLINTLVR